MIYAVGATNVTIEGPGTIEGDMAFSPGLHGSSRPYGLLFYRCKNLVVRHIDLLRCPYHMVRGSRAHTFSSMASTSTIASARTTTASTSSVVNTSTSATATCNARTTPARCSAAEVRHCDQLHVQHAVVGVPLGGGVAENIAVSNCVFSGVFGCPIKFHGGSGSSFQNMSFSNLIFQDATGPIHVSVSSPVGMTLPEGPPEPAPPQPAQPVRREGPAVVRNISFSNIRGNVLTTWRPKVDYYQGRGHGEGEAFSAIVLNCVGSAVMENISVDDVHLTFGGGGTAEMAADRDVPKRAGEYFSLGAIPAYGVYARGVKGLTLSNLRLQVATKELRPAIIFERVTDAALYGVSAEGNAEAESLLRFVDVKDVLLTASRVLTPAAVFLSVEGPDNANIIIEGGDLSKAAKPLRFASGADEKAVKLRA